MAIAALRQVLTAPSTRWSDPRMLFWYGLSLLFAAYYGYLVLHSAFGTPWVVQDDARQHVFWMQRWLDPGLFPNDFMADYFQSQAPIGYTALYRGAAAIGIPPLTFNKLLPPILGLLSTHYCFRLSLQLLPIPAVAFTSSLLLNQTCWMRDDLVSGTPRAFVYVLLLAFLVYVNGRAVIPCIVVLALQPLFYPHCALISGGVLVLQLCKFSGGRLSVVQDPKIYRLSGLGLGLLFCLLAPYALANSEFGPLITPAVARTMPEFGPGGRAAYFTHNPLLLWFGDRSGFFPTPILTPPTLAFSLWFPWLWRQPQRFPWLQTIRGNGAILQHLVIASFGLYFAAHLVLFKLHLPSRYTHHSLRIVLALTASFALCLGLDYLLKVIEKVGHSPQVRWQKSGAIAAIAFVLMMLINYAGLTQSFPFTNNRYGTVPALYGFLRGTAADTIVASLTKETSNLQVFAQRSPLISPELGLPYHTAYYQEFRQRTVDLITAQYSPDPNVIKDFIRQYAIDFWLLDNQVWSIEFLQENRWFQQYQPAAGAAISNLTAATPLPMQRAIDHCTVLQTAPQYPPPFVIQQAEDADTYWLLDATCVLALDSSA